jgi:Heparinase II/III-like protein
VAVRSSSLPDGGLIVLASPVSSAQLTLKAGPATSRSRGHSHADALSLCMQSSGRALLIDPGTYYYLGEGRERNLYRGTAMHNTLTVDGLDQAEPAGPFSWKHELPVQIDQSINGETFDLFLATHRGYSGLSEPVQHRRWVVALKSGIFLVRDLAAGKGEHRLELSWRLAPELQLIQEHLFRMKKSSQGLAVLPLQNHGWSEEVHKGPWSPVYGVQRTTTVLKFGTCSTLPAEFVTLLIPMPEASSIPGSFSRLRPQASSETVRSYHYQTKEGDHHFFFADSGRQWKCGPAASDGEFVHVHSRSSAGATDVVLCNGSYVELEGKRVLAASRPIQRCELVNLERPQVFSSDPEAVTEPVPLNPAKSVT